MKDIYGVDKQVYEAEEIAYMLGMGRSKTYQFLEEVYKKQSPFRVIRIGKLVRVSKQSFDAWLEGGAEN